MTDPEEHLALFLYAYNRFPCEESGEVFRVWFAEQYASKVSIRYALSETGPVWPRPYAAEDYLSDVGDR